MKIKKRLGEDKVGLCFLKRFSNKKKIKIQKKLGEDEKIALFFIKHISNQKKKNDSKKTVGRIESERLVLFLFIYLN